MLHIIYYISYSLLPSISIDYEVQRQCVQRQWCTVGIESCCGISNEASLALAAVVEVQMEVLTTVQTSSACAS